MNGPVVHQIEIHHLWMTNLILVQNNLLEGALCKNSIFSLFLVFRHDLSDALIFYPYRSFKHSK